VIIVRVVSLLDLDLRRVIEGIAKIAEGFRSRRSRLQENVAKALELLLRVAGVYQLVVDECSDSGMCDGYRDAIFIDFVRALRERVVIDTNVVYGVCIASYGSTQNMYTA